jgi:stress response protein YsnF
VLAKEEISAGGFFTERVIEVAETREEAVVDKQVVVSEEVVLRKSAADHVETVDETVRRTDVEVEELRAPEGAAERLE